MIVKWVRGKSELVRIAGVIAESTKYVQDLSSISGISPQYLQSTVVEPYQIIGSLLEPTVTMVQK